MSKDLTCLECGGEICFGYGTIKPIYPDGVPENGLCSCWEDLDQTDLTLLPESRSIDLGGKNENTRT